jgi:CHAT domain-containing protein
MEFGGDPAVLLEQGRYGELLTVLERSPGSAEALVWAVRCRVEQGYIRAAADLARKTPPLTQDLSDVGRALRLWRGFLALYESGDRSFAEVVAGFYGLCEEFAAGASPPVIALAADLRCRAEVMRFVLSGMGLRHRGALVSGLAATAEGYRTAGLLREAAGALRRAASFACDGLAVQRAEGRELLAQASAEAAASGLVIAQGKADLALAELDFRALLDGAGELDKREVTGKFDAAAEAFRAGGHAFGDALVMWSAARWLLVYGQSGGLDLARAAAGEFAAADVPSSELQVWQALQAWYAAHGDPRQSRQARSHATRLVPGMGFALAAEVRALDEANQAFRSGNVARARSLLARRSRTAPGLQAASRLMLATSVNAVGLRAEALALLEAVVSDLTTAGASLLLGEALALLATMLSGADSDRAAALLRQAAGVAQAAESPAEEAKYRAQLGWLIVTRRMAARLAPFLDQEAAAEFGRAESLLAGQRTLEAAGELVKLYQYRGQVAFLAADWDQCGTWLTKAENAARAYGFLPELAFILSYQGMALIQVGRSAGPATYDHAARILGESQGLFRQVELPAFVWQSGFYRALCDIEAARWPQTAAQRDVRLHRAGRLMEDASRAIDRLRESSERGEAERQQQVWMAFSVDKQVFYGQGFQLSWDARAEPGAAWQWLERMKGRALLDGLSIAVSPDAGTADAGSRTRIPARRKKAAARQSGPPGYTEIRALLAAEEAASGRRVVIAEYLCTPERTVLFGARADWAEPRAEPVPLDYAALRRFTAATFRTPGGVRMMMQDRGDGGIGEWHGFAPVLAPLAAWTDPDDVIYLVPFGLLHDLPLHTLPIGGVPLLERNPVCYAPAAAVLRHTLRGGGPAAAPYGAAAVFGDARGDLPYAREEASAVAGMLGTTAALGADVTRERMLRALRTADAVHVAGHGHLSTADGFASGIDLAGGDSLLAGDLLGQRCSAQLAVLSGCDTGVSELRPGDEAVGFIRALLLSGVRSILASQWQVSDASTRDLLRRFHEAARDPAVPLAEALRQAARSVRADPRYAHPYHWGSFTLVGSWR